MTGRDYRMIARLIRKLPGDRLIAAEPFAATFAKEDPWDKAGAKQNSRSHREALRRAGRRVVDDLLRRFGLCSVAAAQRLGSAVDDIAEDVVLRVDQSVNHL